MRNPPFWRIFLELFRSIEQATQITVSDLGRCPPPKAEDAEAAKGLLKTLSPASSLLQISARDPRDFPVVLTGTGKPTGSTISTLLRHKINPKDFQVLSLGDSGFLQFFKGCFK